MARAPMAMRLDEAISGVRTELGVKVFGDDLDVLQRKAEEVRAVIAGVRLRPVLMTALVASVGFIPMATSTSPGSEVQRPLATVVIGGLITSTLLTMIVLPVVYQWLEERWPGWAASFHHQVRRRRHKAARTQPPAGSAVSP